MAVPTSQLLIHSAFQDIWSAFISVQSGGLMVRNQTAGGAAASASAFLALADYCVQLKSTVTTYQANTTLWNGIITYASTAAPGGMTLTDLTNAYNASNALLSAIGGEYPHDGSGRLLDRSYNLTTGMAWVTLTAAQMPNTMTAITGYLATLS